MGSKLSRVFVVLALLTAVVSAQSPPGTSPRNVILIVADDLGYGDLGCFGAKDIPTPHLDRLAESGLRLTSFYVSQAVCSASRASILTGAYSNRVGIFGALFPAGEVGLSHDETTLAEVFRSRGFATGFVGKWHLGHRPEHLPRAHGFDSYFGIPYSNDMWPDPREGFERKRTKDYKDYPLPLIENERSLATISTMEDQDGLTERYVQRSLNFITTHTESPFFLCLFHAMPHVPLGVSERFRGKTERGPYGDVIAEIDDGVGRIVALLEAKNLKDDTLIVFTSDNGPWLPYGNHAGSAGPLREGKGTMWEGGARVPCIVHWPRGVPKGRVIDGLTATVDLMPTLAGLVGAQPPARRIDGVDLAPLLFGSANASPREQFAYYYGQELRALREGPWKLVFAHSYVSLDGKPPGENGRPGPQITKTCSFALYNLDEDLGETRDRAVDFPEVVTRLLDLATRMRGDLGDTLAKTPATNGRPPAKVSTDPWLVCAPAMVTPDTPQVVLISGDEEYRSEEALPMLARVLATHHGFRATVLFPIDPKSGMIDPSVRNHLPGFELLRIADLVVIATRFRTPNDEAMSHLEAYLASGKPVLGLRTATHAFAIEAESKSRFSHFDWRSTKWPGGFGRQILGTSWVAHHGEHGRESTRGVMESASASHPVLRDVRDLWGKSDVYAIDALPSDAQVLVRGQVLTGMTPDAPPVAGVKNNPMVPIVWTRARKLQDGRTAKVLASTLGSASDFASEDFRRLIVNACYWLVGREVPKAARADPVTPFDPSPSGFGGHKKNLRPQSFQ